MIVSSSTIGVDLMTPVMMRVACTAVQGLRFSCYSWARGYHSWTREPWHPVHVIDFYATESQTPLEHDLCTDRFSVVLLLYCSPPTQGQNGGRGKGVWRPGATVFSCQCGKKNNTSSFSSDFNQLVIAIAEHIVPRYEHACVQCCLIQKLLRNLYPSSSIV